MSSLSFGEVSTPDNYVIILNNVKKADLAGDG